MFVAQYQYGEGYRLQPLSHKQFVTNLIDDLADIIQVGISNAYVRQVDYIVFKQTVCDDGRLVVRRIGIVSAMDSNRRHIDFHYFN